MAVAIITGSGGLVGSAAVRLFCARGFDVVGVDNDMRQYFFGPAASTSWNVRALRDACPRFTPCEADIRDRDALKALFSRYGKDVGVVVHTAAQPSHDWAVREPLTDFGVNALGTLNLLELARQRCPDAVFIFTSTNKVYGDGVNRLRYRELDTRFEPEEGEPYAEHGVDEGMTVDQTLHSVFGASKVAADVLVQEYGRYFGMRTGVFRGGCLTGPDHSAAQLHGFLGYLMRCAVRDVPYTVFGHSGKQVRDNIHADDVASAFWHFFQAPRPGEVYNIGGGRHSNISMREAIAACEKLTGKTIRVAYRDEARVGDHKWWISDVRKFRSHYPAWNYAYDIDAILRELREGVSRRSAEAGE